MNVQLESVTAAESNQYLLSDNRNEPPRYDWRERGDKRMAAAYQQLRFNTPSLVHAKNYADRCAYCGRAIAASEPIGLVHVAHDGTFGPSFTYAAVGFCCYWEGENDPHRRYPARRQYAAKRQCTYCGRVVWDARVTLPARSFCCTQCRNRFYQKMTLQQREREKNPLSITCNVCCGAIPDSKRGDVRYCSSACRQKAYRQRKQGAVR